MVSKKKHGEDHKYHPKLQQFGTETLRVWGIVHSGCQWMMGFCDGIHWMGFMGWDSKMELTGPLKDTHLESLIGFDWMIGY